MDIKHYYSKVLVVVICLGGFLTFPGGIKAQSLMINEVMSSNGSIIADKDGDYEDWIEIYNGETDSIQLEGFGLTDDRDELYRWIFPDTIIAPGKFVLVWASGKKRALGNGKLPFFKRLGIFLAGKRIPGEPRPLHTNFSIKSDGETIILTDPAGNEADRVPKIEIERDNSYGRYPDGTDEWFFFNEPTPGKPNRMIIPDVPGE